MDHQTRQLRINGLAVTVDDSLGKLMVAHDGTLGWDQLQAIKNAVWGHGARAIEVYPVQGAVVNSGNFRHLWRLGPGDFCPDLLGHDPSDPEDDDNLEYRHLSAWAGADEVFA